MLNKKHLVHSWPDTFIKISCMLWQESVNSIIEYKSVDSKITLPKYFYVILCVSSRWQLEGEKTSDIMLATVTLNYMTIFDIPLV